MYRVEKYYPLVVSIIISVSFFYIAQDLKDISLMAKNILDTSLTICGTLLGFLLTILTIINSIETRRMRFIRESGNYSTLMGYLKIALTSNIICISSYFIYPIILSIGVLGYYKNLIYSVAIFIVSFAWLVNIRFASIFIKLLTDPESK